MSFLNIPFDVNRLLQDKNPTTTGLVTPVSASSAIRQILSSLDSQPGDMIQAEVLKVKSVPTKERTAANAQYQVLLKIAGQTLTLLSQYPLPEQSTVQLRLERDLTLKLIEVLPNKETLAIQSAIRSAIAQQTGLGPTLANLLSLQTSPQPSAPSSIPPNTQLSSLLPVSPQQLTFRAAELLFIQLPETLNALKAILPQAKDFQGSDVKTLTPLIKQWLQNNGQFLENKLVQTYLAQSAPNQTTEKTQFNNTLTHDLKTQLNRTQKIFELVLQELKQSNAAALTQEPKLQALRAFYSLTLYFAKLSPETSSLQPSQNNPSANAFTPTSINAQPSLAPPLPGHPFLNAQPIASPTLGQGGLVNDIFESLIKQVKQSLARALLTQLTNLQSWTQPSDPNQRVINLELPIQDQSGVQVAQCQIEKRIIPIIDEEETSEKTAPKQIHLWRVNLSIDLESLGAIYLLLTLRMPTSPASSPASIPSAEQTQASAQLWAKEQKTVSLATESLETLKTMLVNIGLNVTHVQCDHGEPPQTKTALDHQLLDLKT